MNVPNEDRLKKLLQQTLPPVEADAGPERDLWPAMQRRLNAKPAADASDGFRWAWFDGALAVGLVGLAAFFPSSIPVLLYYL
jgi:hypothetical protein